MAASTIVALLVGAAISSACTIPAEPLENNIDYFFRAQVQNASRPEVHNKYMNLYESGGGDQHLFIGPVGMPTYDLTLVEGVINHAQTGVRAVIGGEYSEIDHTTKMFMTGRDDPRAVFQPTYACNPDTDELQIELRFVTWQGQPEGGHICLRSSFDDSHEFRLARCDDGYRCTGDPAQNCGSGAWLSLYERCEEGAPCENEVFT
ncbi:hypothetical protein VTH06DRAFT_265 [Thermothelomyces fergusii]